MSTESKKVDRFEPDRFGLSMDKVPNGSYVRFEDYAALYERFCVAESQVENANVNLEQVRMALRSQNASIQAENERLRAALEFSTRKERWATSALIDINRCAQAARMNHSVRGHQCDLRRCVDAVCDRASKPLDRLREMEQAAARAALEQRP